MLEIGDKSRKLLQELIEYNKQEKPMQHLRVEDTALKILTNFLENAIPPQKEGTYPYRVYFTEIQEIVELLKKRVVINPLKTKVSSPLVKAARFGDTRVVEALTMLGADVNYEDVDGHTASYHSHEQGYNEIEMFLRMKGANNNHIRRT